MPPLPLSAELVEANYASGVWQPRALYEVIDEHARTRPDHPAVADQHERLTYAELVRRSHSLAGYLLGLGLRPGAAVALQASNRVALAVTHLACDRADLLFVPLSNAWRHTEMAYLLAASEAAVVIVPQPEKGFDYAEMIQVLRPDLPCLKHVGSLDGLAAGAQVDFDEVSRRSGCAPVVIDRDPNAPRYVMVTSGTTELPRISLWSDNNLWCFMQTFIESVHLSSEDRAVGICPANTGATGYVFPVLGPLLAGASSTLLEHWSPQAALELIQAERATTATAVPAQALKMLQDDAIGGYDFSALRIFTNAGAAMPPHAAQRLEEAFSCTGHVCYGATDGGVPAMTSVTDPPAKRYSTVGRILDYSEVRLLDALGKQVEAGQIGEIIWRSPTKSYGYLNEPERTEAAFDAEGFYHSGDLGQLDEDGYLSIVGRTKDLIIRGGQNVSPQELEIILSRHPAVAEVSVIGVPDPVLGERACACVVPRAGQPVTLDDLVGFLVQQSVAKFKMPERLELFEELPKNAGGKVTKVKLRSEVERRGQDASV